ncbi:disulfide bond formation protein DsbA [Vespertiliibacter pulmonis]|uniref:Putative DsbA family dithiol-disulfide isomerase n=1 Tax=Vespertiliibacter pulmonis TaxID=1443036 RepID=A0A3N4WF42_9PAST|nr:DsbA family oxidoreductase [Vespertiliibacter pulmonis]QLB21028.1 disulfide bond formation protein DsbA [Vespertiliibacter pulmonis]RPE83874.1 putative DsbA family dithiol-disulfide isomerase [Vespertiliibacter pulmonis]
MKIEIWSDIICPFCYIGKRKLEMALAQTGIDADIEWHSFELNPDAPQSYGVPLPEMLNKMYGFSPERALSVLEYEQQTAESVGLDFQWKIAKPGNTFNAHRLIHLGKSLGIGDQVKERFLKAYFTEGQEIGNAEVLRKLAIEVGLAEALVDAVLSTNQFADAVRADEKEASIIGIRGVPYFLINDEISIAGAQEISEFVRVLTEQAQKTQVKTTATAKGMQCEGGECKLSD